MEDKKTFFVYLITALTVLLNFFMLFIARTGNENIFSNIFVILIALFCLKIYIIAIKTNQTSKMRPEFYGILFLFGVSAMRFLNRIIQISDAINYFSIIVFLGAGTFFLFTAIGRISSNIKNRK
ncbi:hypothetical protein KPL47_19950 [Clostridium estertheticum]|uniref:hypothetical protein n=1 Tax=Clostridium estertheticum TaxID=238834 RepID=UPI001C0D51F7|nr:hypothetical protein [Clostridium estertheticum]MBU3178593.1 hypothetical protein [Clostridium estertheticum]